MKISNRIFTTTGAIYLVASIIIVILVNYEMRKQAFNEAESKALMLLNHNLAAHQYLQEMKLKLFSWSESFRPPDYFEPTWMSSTYAIRQINHYFRLLEKAKYYYKECAINARTLENEADPHERVFLEQLAKDPKLAERSEVRTMNGQPFLVIMRRGLEMKKTCLQCHSTPDRAPGDLVKIYGPTRGFGRLEGEEVHAISIRIPLAEAYGQANRLSWQLSGILLALLGCLFASQTWIGKHLLFDPMAALRQKALEIAQSDARLGETIPVPPGPELRDLTTAFNAMSRNLRQSHDFLEKRVRQRTADLNQLNERLEQDILQRKQAEAALQESEAQYRLLAENVIDVIWTIDLNWKITYASPSCENLCGYKDKELVGMTLDQLLTPDSMDLCKKTLAELLSPENLARQEYPTFLLHHLELPFKDGSRIVYIEVKGSFLKDSQGQPSGMVGVARDITERKKLEDQFLQAQKMEAVGTLAGGIAHDFNNILTAILGNIGLAALDDKIGPPVRDRLAQAEAACLRAQALSQQLLTFAKGGAPVRKLFSVAELLTESTTFACVGSPVRCEATCPENLWWIEGDPGQIGQVFHNLTINAVQAMPIGGTIKVWAENLTLGTDSGLPLSAGRYIKISVRDQGMGIPAEHLPRIFDPYFTTKQKGSGLGLASAYAIIKKHNGHIAVESKPGVETTFHIYLSAVERQVTPQPEKDRELLVGTGKILVMDDEEMVREVLGGMLARLGYEAEFARDGGEAIEMFVKAQESGQAFAAVILDLTVPGGMGGKEAIKELLKIAPQVKAIVSSGYSDDLIMADFQKYGFAAVIAKPYKISELGKVLNNTLIGNE
jgi:PAS domain S-box-containing protein